MIQLPIIILKKDILSDMHYRTTYMHSNFQQNRVSRSVKTVHTNLLAKQRKLHIFATCNSNLENHAFQIYTTPLATFKSILQSIGLLDIKLPRK